MSVSKLPYQAYVAPIGQLITGNAAADNRAVVQEFSTQQNVFASTQSLLPQACTTAPKNPIDGMVRLARSPWMPLGTAIGTNIWVYYDGLNNVWAKFG